MMDMDSLQQALAHGTIEDAVNIISRRLAGDHLDTPIMLQTSEAPREALVRVWRDSTGTFRFEEAVQALIERDVLRKLAEQLQSPEMAKNVEWLTEFFGLALDIHLTNWPRSLVLLCEQLALRVEEADTLREIQRISLFAYASTHRGSEHTLALCVRAYLDLEAARDMCLATASADPKFFLTILGPHVLTAFADKEDSKLAFLGDAIQNAVDLIHYESGNPRTDGLADFLSHAAHMAVHRAGPEVRSIVSSALARSRAPIDFLHDFEREYWRQHNPADLDALNLSKPLGDFVREQSGSRTLKPGTLRMNVFPYAEAAYLRLFSHSMKAAFDIDTVFQNVDYRKVLQALSSNRINIAAHNGSILRQGYEKLNKKILVRSVPLVRFRDYQVIASVDRLKALLSEVLSPRAKELVLRLLDGDPLQSFYELYGENRAAFSEMVEKAELTFLRDTDTEKAARAFFGQSANRFSSLSPDDGIVQVLDGKIGFYVGGALQSRYATAACPTRAICVAQIPEQTEVYFYSLRSEYQRSHLLYDQAVLTWRAISDISSWLVSKTRAPRKFEHLLPSLRDDILTEINRQSGSGAGFAGTFEQLAEILEKHDVLCDINVEKNFFVEVRPNGTPDTVAERPVAAISGTGKSRLRSVSNGQDE